MTFFIVLTVKLITTVLYLSENIRYGLKGIIRNKFNQQIEKFGILAF